MNDFILGAKYGVKNKNKKISKKNFQFNSRNFFENNFLLRVEKFKYIFNTKFLYFKNILFFGKYYIPFFMLGINYLYFINKFCKQFFVKFALKLNNLADYYFGNIVQIYSLPNFLYRIYIDIMTSKNKSKILYFNNKYSLSSDKFVFLKRFRSSPLYNFFYKRISSIYKSNSDLSYYNNLSILKLLSLRCGLNGNNFKKKIIFEDEDSIFLRGLYLKYNKNFI